MTENRKNKSVGFVAQAAIAAAVVGTVAAFSPIASAASATWSATPTNGNWEASGAENNWSTGAGTFPGIVGGTSSTDVATFNQNSTTSAIVIDAATTSTSQLNIGGIGFSGNALSMNYVIGSPSGNSLGLTANATSSTSSGNQIFISNSLRSAPVTAVTETISAPIVILPQSATAQAWYYFQNASVGLSSGDALVFAGPISGGTTSSTVTLQLIGTNTNTNNVVSGAISAGSATGGVSINKGGVGTWALTGNSSLGSNLAASAGTATTPVLNAGGGSLTLSGNNTFTASTPNTGNGNLINVAGAATLVLSGTNTLTTTSFNNAITVGGGSTLSVNSIANALGGATRINLGGSSNSGRFLYTGTGETTAIGIGSTSSGTSSAIVDQSGTSGTLTINGNTALGGIVSLVLQGSTSASGIYGGVIADGTAIGANLTKNGTGTWELSNSNTYTGTTTVNAGKLRLTDSAGSATGTGPVNLSGGTTTTLAGTGFSTGLLTATNGSRLAPGLNTSGANGNFGVTGTLSLGTTGGITLTSGNADFDLAASAAGTNDQILTGGTFTPTSLAFTFNELTPGSLDTSTAYTLLSGFTNTPSLAGITGTVLQGDYTPTFSLSGNALQVSFTSVPEPTSLALFGLVSTGLLRRRRLVNEA